MLSTLTLAGLRAGNGDHVFNPKGLSTVSGPMGAGKSTLIGAALALLTGDYVPLDPGGKAATVTGTFADGTTATIRQTASGRRFKLQRGEQVVYDGASVEAYRAAVGPHAHPDADEVLRAIALPGRALCYPSADLVRLLARVTPHADLAGAVRAIVGEDFDAALLAADTGGKTPRPVPPTSPDYADALVDTLRRAQRDANKARDEAKGRADATAAQLARLAANEPPAIDNAAVAAAQRTVQTAAAWERFDADMAAHKAAVVARAEAIAARDAHAAAVKALGKRPELDAGEAQAARMKVDAARKALREAEEANRNEAETARLAAVRAEAEARQAEAVRAAEERVRAEAAQKAASATRSAPAPAADPTPAPALFAAPEPKPAPVAPRSIPCPTCNGTGRVPDTAADSNALDF